MFVTPADEPLPGEYADTRGDEAGPGNAPDQRPGPAADQLRGGEHGSACHQTVDEMIDGSVGIVDPKVHSHLAGSDLLDNSLNVAR